MNFTYSKLASNSQLQIGYKGSEKINTNQIKYKIMIRLPKKIEETIKRELTQNYSVLRRVFIESPTCKSENVHLIVLSVNRERLIILRYWGDNSYSFLSGYNNFREVRDELAFQVSNLY